METEFLPDNIATAEALSPTEVENMIQEPQEPQETPKTQPPIADSPPVSESDINKLLQVLDIEEEKETTSVTKTKPVTKPEIPEWAVKAKEEHQQRMLEAHKRADEMRAQAIAAMATIPKLPRREDYTDSSMGRSSSSRSSSSRPSASRASSSTMGHSSSTMGHSSLSTRPPVSRSSSSRHMPSSSSTQRHVQWEDQEVKYNAWESPDRNNAPVNSLEEILAALHDVENGMATLDDTVADTRKYAAENNEGLTSMGEAFSTIGADIEDIKSANKILLHEVSVIAKVLKELQQEREETAATIAALQVQLIAKHAVIPPED